MAYPANRTPIFVSNSSTHVACIARVSVRILAFLLHALTVILRFSSQRRLCGPRLVLYGSDPHVVQFEAAVSEPPAPDAWKPRVHQHEPHVWLRRRGGAEVLSQVLRPVH